MFSKEGKVIRLEDDSKTLKVLQYYIFSSFISYTFPFLHCALNFLFYQSYGVESGSSLDFKDLGPQIGYRTVFLVEYFGPILFVLLYSLRPSFLYGSSASQKPFHWAATAAIACWVLHFVKRELETIFIHKFSRYALILMEIMPSTSHSQSF